MPIKKARHYGGDEGGSHYSALGQINRDNVGKLKLAWSYQTGDIARHPDRKAFASFHATPLLLPEAAGRSLVFCTPFIRIVALDPATGKERWAWDPAADLGPMGTRFNCRGIAYWEDAQAPADQRPAAIACSWARPTCAWSPSTRAAARPAPASAPQARSA